MQAIALTAHPRAGKAVVTGRVLSSLLVVFYAFDGIMKLVKPAPVVEATVKMGFPEGTIAVMGVLLLAGTVLYSFRRTSILGAIILTGYLGGAVAAQLRIGMGWFSESFPVIFGILTWFALWIRDERLKALIPLREE